MNDIRRSILWVVFGLSMVLIWDKWQIHNGKPATFFPGATPPAATAPAAGASGAAPASGQAAVPAAGNAPAGNAPASAPDAAATRHEVRTDRMVLTFSSEGGALIGADLLAHRQSTLQSKTPDDGPFTLLTQDGKQVYVAQTGLIGGSFPTHKTPMTLVGSPTALADGQDSLDVVFESADVGGVKLVKTYTLQRGSYVIGVRHEVVNTGTAPVSPQLYVQLVRDGSKLDSETPFYSTFTGPAVYTAEQKYQKVEFGDITNNKASFVKTSNDGYVAMVQHYFASAWILPADVKRTFSLDARDVGATVADCCYRATMITPLETVAPGQTKAVEAKLFVGPQEEKKLEALAPGMELVKDYGWLTILAKPLYWLLDKLHSFIQNWGWSIVALVLLLKIAFYWLNAKAYASMAKMKAVNPRIMEMRERLKDNPQQMQQEMMRIYREEKVNPMGGCFPIMVQIPVFIALYWVLLSSVEMRNAPWILWIQDLSSPDPFFILPVVMTLTTLLQTALNPAPPDPLQAKMMWFMPLAFSVMFFFFPSGLVLYWITNNILSIAQQWIINTRMGVPPQFNLPKFK